MDFAGTNTNLPFACGGPGIPGNAQCNSTNISRTTDPVAGNFALRYFWPKSAGIGVLNWTVIYSWHNTTHYLDIPPNSYIEEVFRLDAAGNNNDGQYTSAVDVPYLAGSAFGTGPNPLLKEHDITEESQTDNGIASAGTICWPMACPQQNIQTWTSYAPNNPNVPAGFSPYVYHTFGMLITSDGHTSQEVCFFIDGILQKCVAPNTETAMYTQRNVFVFANGNPLNPSTPGVINSSTNSLAWVKSFRVWYCPLGVVPAGTAPTAGTSCNGAGGFHTGSGNDPSYYLK